MIYFYLNDGSGGNVYISARMSATIRNNSTLTATLEQPEEMKAQVEPVYIDATITDGQLSATWRRHELTAHIVS